MSNDWFQKVVADIGATSDAIVYYTTEYEAARKDIPFVGRIEGLCQKLPGIFSYRWAQLQEIESIIEHLQLLEEKERTSKTRWYMEHYNRQINERTARDYASTDDEVLAIIQIRHQVALVRNKFIALTKGYETMHYQLSNIVKLHCAGLEDATLR